MNCIDDTYGEVEEADVVIKPTTFAVISPGLKNL